MKKNEFTKILEKLGKDYTIEGDNLTVGGSLYLSGTKITSLPDNLTVGGWLNLRGTQITSLPDNLTVGSSLDLSGTKITSLPDNLTVGGSLYLRGTQITEREIKKVKKLPADFYIKYRNYVESKLVWQNGKYRVVDGIFCEVIKQHKNIIEVKIQNKKAYIFTKNNVNAHGCTIKQAYRDWLFKTSDRDVKQYEDLTLTTEKDLNYWLVCYRTITGACSFGTENFLETNKEKYKEKMTLKEVFEATEGQYGHNTFVEFFKAAV